MIALIKKEWLEILRTKKLLILIIIFLFVAVSSPILAKLIPTIFKNLSMQGITISIPEPTWRDAIDQFIKNIGQIALIVIVFLFAGAVAEEKNKKNLEILLTKPVSRLQFIFAKYLSAIASTTVVYIAASLLFYMYTVSLFSGFSLSRFAFMALLVLIYLLQAIAVTIFASTLASNQILAAGLAFFVEIILVTILGSIDKISKYLPGYILGQYRNLMESGQFADFAPSIIVSLLIIMLSFILAALFFSRQEIER